MKWSHTEGKQPGGASAHVGVSVPIQQNVNFVDTNEVCELQNAHSTGIMKEFNGIFNLNIVETTS